MPCWRTKNVECSTFRQWKITSCPTTPYKLGRLWETHTNKHQANALTGDGRGFGKRFSKQYSHPARTGATTGSPIMPSSWSGMPAGPGRGTSRKSLRSWIKRVVLPLIPAWSWDMKPGSSAAMLWAWSDLREDETLHITGGGQTGRDVWIPSDIAEWPHKPCTAHLYCSSVHGDSSGKNPGVGCHVLLQGNLSNPGTEPRSPALHSLLSEPPGKPKLLIRWIN